MEEIRASGKQIKDVLASLGNLNIWGNHLKYFVQKVKELNEVDKFISEAPNYFAWINLASEYIAWYIRGYCFFNSQLNNDIVFDENYKALIDRFSEFPQVKKSETVLDNSIYFIKVRHIIVHKGFPNPHKIPSRASRPISKGVSFGEDDVWLVRNEIMEPKHFPIIYSKFESIIRWLQKNQKDMQIGF